MAMIRTKQLEVRKRRGLMIAVWLLAIGLPVIFLGLRLLFHALDPKSYGPAGSPGVFESLVDPIAEFGFIIAATLGATLGATDLTEGVFRQLVVTGRSRVSLYLARIPAGLSIVLPLIALGFTMNCLVTSYAGIAQPKSVNVNGFSIPANLNERQLETWMHDHPQEAAQDFGYFRSAIVNGKTFAAKRPSASEAYAIYSGDEQTQFNPSISAMVKIGLWLELVIGTGLLVGLGLGSLTGQRTVSTILIIVLQIIVTPILSAHVIPYFLNGQRVIVGVALTQLRPAGLVSPNSVGGGPRHIIFGGRGALGIPPMPTWAMIMVIVGWIVGWTVIGAWRMRTRDA
jgi:hypothetical protein